MGISNYVEYRDENIQSFHMPTTILHHNIYYKVTLHGKPVGDLSISELEQLGESIQLALQARKGYTHE